VEEEDEVVDPDGELVVLDDEAAGGVEGDVVVVDELVDVSLLPGVVVVDEDEEAGGAGGTTTVVELELGGVARVVESAGVCCWQAPSASSRLAATAVIVRRVIDRAPSFWL
jgi:hypothetical protein